MTGRRPVLNSVHPEEATYWKIKDQIVAKPDVAMRPSLVIAAVLCMVVGDAMAADTGMPQQAQNPSNIPTERLKRPQRSPADSPTALYARLTQAEAIKLAKTVAKKEKGKAFDDYNLQSVTFDPINQEWTASFGPKASRGAAEGCLLVIVKDDSKETKVLRC